jgi:hypothetical protein
MLTALMFDRLLNHMLVWHGGWPVGGWRLEQSVSRLGRAVDIMTVGMEVAGAMNPILPIWDSVGFS